MGEAPEIQLRIQGEEEEKLDENRAEVEQQTKGRRKRRYKWWVLIIIYTLFLLSGQSVATLLGRLYYEKGGKSEWVGSLVQVTGFPILIPLYYLSSSMFKLKKSSNSSSSTANANNNNKNNNNKPSSSSSLLLLVSGMYFGLGLLSAAGCLLYSFGLKYLPVSTYSLISASQLAFNALFSFFLNSQNFTPFIINSLVLLTISSTLLVFQTDSSTPVPKSKYVTGFVCTVAASAGYGLLLSLTQLCFQKILKKQTFKVVLDMIIYQSLVATLIIFVGLFGSGNWRSLGEEMEGFQLGKASYINVLVWTAVGWQVFSIGAVGLIFEASSLFSNVISTLGLPIVPVFAMLFFHDPVNEMKVVSMVLAIWGFVSYLYHHYLHHPNSDTAIV